MTNKITSTLPVTSLLVAFGAAVLSVAALATDDVGTAARSESEGTEVPVTELRETTEPRETAKAPETTEAVSQADEHQVTASDESPESSDRVATSVVECGSKSRGLWPC